MSVSGEANFDLHATRFATKPHRGLGG